MKRDLLQSIFEQHAHACDRLIKRIERSAERGRISEERYETLSDAIRVNQDGFQTLMLKAEKAGVE